MDWTFQVSNTYGIQSHPLKDLIEVHIDLLLHLHPQQLDHGAKGDFDHHHHNLFYMNDTTLTSSPSCNWQNILMTREIEEEKNTAKLYGDALVWTAVFIDWLDWFELAN